MYNFLLIFNAFKQRRTFCTSYHSLLLSLNQRSYITAFPNALSETFSCSSSTLSTRKIHSVTTNWSPMGKKWLFSMSLLRRIDVLLTWIITRLNDFSCILYQVSPWINVRISFLMFLYLWYTHLVQNSFNFWCKFQLFLRICEIILLRTLKPLKEHSCALSKAIKICWIVL